MRGFRPAAWHTASTIRRAVIGAERYGRLPYVARLLAENVLRNIGRPGCTLETLSALVDPAVPPDGAALALHVPRIIFPELVRHPCADGFGGVALRGRPPRRRSRSRHDADPDGFRGRPFPAGRRPRLARCCGAEHRARIPAQRRTIPLPEMGADRLRRRAGFSSGIWHHPPDQSRTDCAGDPCGSRRRAACRLPRFRSRRQIPTHP